MGSEMCIRDRNKLAQLANESITDEVLDARKQQAIAVYQNRAWKMLLRL